ncbi:hypothetical protein CQA53_07905 [Helicobacter didelphidarum]|uniref:Uncharacterized protein n=1 Tax=Helicobacter didelphidarum TaxID=2040648 RepID=A0A3D8IGK6_9HELI|nr:hypothetical protein [Helicobacter didelphidarum]RDU64056.1 hypothetical protein CQA53_07905 [Helicobacter didelphidarum]
MRFYKLKKYFFFLCIFGIFVYADSQPNKKKTKTQEIPVVQPLCQILQSCRAGICIYGCENPQTELTFVKYVIANTDIEKAYATRLELADSIEFLLPTLPTENKEYQVTMNDAESETKKDDSIYQVQNYEIKKSYNTARNGQQEIYQERIKASPNDYSLMGAHLMRDSTKEDTQTKSKRTNILIIKYIWESQDLLIISLHENGNVVGKIVFEKQGESVIIYDNVAFIK